jgi:3-deoxy-7-phosphoheptulonate synthase
MIIVMRVDARPEDIERVVHHIHAAGCEPNLDRGHERTIIGIRTGRHDLLPETFKLFPGVEDAVRILKPYKLTSREFHQDDTSFVIGGAPIGGGACMIIAGPCSVESEEQAFATARAVKAAGATMFRGGAFKPRSSPYAFQGMGEAGLKLLADAGRAAGLPVVTEIMHSRNIDLVAAYADMLQIGARNMQNYDLLKEVAAAGKPVFLKRGLSATVEELLLSAEYLLAGGCERVILCERGIRTFETATRNTLDIAAVPVLKRLSHLPIAVDPSHACGVSQYVESLALAGVAAGADALMIEVHPDPATAKCDGAQSLTFERFAQLMDRLRPVAQALGRTL